MPVFWWYSIIRRTIYCLLKNILKFTSGGFKRVREILHMNKVYLLQPYITPPLHASVQSVRPVWSPCSVNICEPYFCMLACVDFSPWFFSAFFLIVGLLISLLEVYNRAEKRHFRTDVLLMCYLSDLFAYLFTAVKYEVWFMGCNKMWMLCQLLGDWRQQWDWEVYCYGMLQTRCLHYAGGTRWGLSQFCYCFSVSVNLY